MHMSRKNRKHKANDPVLAAVREIVKDPWVLAELILELHASPEAVHDALGCETVRESWQAARTDVASMVETNKGRKEAARLLKDWAFEASI